MPATSEVQICSNALLLLGDETIASFDENTTRARLCSNLWDTVRDAVLRSHPWNCAMMRVVLAADATAPAFDWAYSFTLPADCLRVWTVGQDDSMPPEWEVENGKLLMDDAIGYVRYVHRLEDAARYDALLRLALTSGMAAALAYPITKSATQQEAMAKLHAMHMRSARTADGQEGTGEQGLDSPLIAVRG
jgi:hypothetical protein